MKRTRKHTLPGFSMVEVVVVVAIIGVAAAIAVPLTKEAVAQRVESGNNSQVETFVGKARSLAVSSQRCTAITINGDDKLKLYQSPTADCVSAGFSAGTWNFIDDMKVSGDAMLVLESSSGSDNFVFRPGGGLRGNADLDMNDDAARVVVGVDNDSDGYMDNGQNLVNIGNTGTMKSESVNNAPTFDPVAINQACGATS